MDNPKQPKLSSRKQVFNKFYVRCQTKTKFLLGLKQHMPPNWKI